jgi:predicted PolB exonuclease-like 3'-5' exonuclease
MDLHDILTNFGAARFNGGLNLAATILGKPGKMEVQGCMVQDMYDQGRLAEINNYCCCDVLDTYFVLLRVCVMMGRLTLDQEQQRIEETKAWLHEQAAANPAFATYLEQWGDWANPWA